jgi:uncharacterized protein
VGCRVVVPRRELIRIVGDSSRTGIEIDLRGNKLGRGAYCHPRETCLKSAQRRVRSSLRLVDPVDLGAVSKSLLAVLG